MNTFTAKVLATILVAGLLNQIAAAGHLGASKQCLDEVAEDFASFIIPAAPLRLESFIRVKVPGKNELTLNMLIDGLNKDGPVVRDMIHGNLESGELKKIDNGCSKFIEDILGYLESTECGQLLMELYMNDKDQFSQILKDEPRIERVVGYINVCSYPAV